MLNRYQGVDPVLTNVAIAYTNDAYIAERLIPSFAVAKQSGKHFVYDKAKFRDPGASARRGSGANSTEVRISLSTGLPYYCEDHALKQFVSDEDVENAVTPTSPYQDATENVSERLLIAREVEAASLLTNLANYPTGNKVTLSGTSQWSDFTNSDPIADVRAGALAVHKAIFKKANTIMLAKPVVNKLLDHPKILERIKYSQMGVTTEQLLARIFDIENVVIGAAGKNTSTEGQADAMDYIWGKDVVIAYIEPRVAPKMITLALNYTWKQRQVERLRGANEEDRKGTYVRVGEEYYDQNIVSGYAGYLIKNAVA